MYTGGNGSGTSRLGTTFLKFQTVRCQAKDILPFFVFFPSRHLHALWTKFKESFWEDILHTKTLNRNRRCNITPTKHIIKQNGL